VRAALAALALVLAARVSAAPRPLLGASYPGARGGFADAARRLSELKAIGFRQVSLIPTYPYVDLDKIDFARGPSTGELESALGAALDSGFVVVLKPHLDPLAYFPGFDRNSPEGRSWRAACPWRGYFDVDPMSADYREGLIRGNLEALSRVLKARPDAPPVRFELGVELMNSVAEHPERWAQLLDFAKAERRRLGLDGRVLLSHNFEHHFEMPNEVAARLPPPGRRALARYVKGLDALALSQYMDLTVAMPPAEIGRRMPTADEVARALVQHEESFRRDVLRGVLGLTRAEIPPLHIGEFGVGTGGLRRPNVWDGELSAEQEKALELEIARGHEGLARYLSRDDGRRALSATLWVTGRHYDVFGWENPRNAIPGAADADRAYLSGR
jgi:hypothetical protein